MKFRKMTAFLLVLCMMLSLSISAFAAEKTPTGYLTWALDDSGTQLKWSQKIQSP